MAFYYNTTTYEVKDFQPELIAAWTANNNPKLNDYDEIPSAPLYNAATQHPPVWVQDNWIIADKTADELAADARKVWETSARYVLEFSLQEMAAISLSTNPTIAALRLLMASWDGEVWSDDPRVIAGLNELENESIIDAGRKLEILAK